MVGTQIALLRKSKGMSQAQLAETLHISPSTVGMYEQGRRTPDLDMVIAMALFFHTSVDYLCTGKERLDTGKEATRMEISKL